MNITLIRIGVFLVAALSPLLTFAWLWQMKEWRIDRLREHYRAEGFWSQTKGKVRPLAFLFGIAATWLAPTPVLGADATLLLFALLSVLQIILKKQRYPVWTKKALTLLLAAILVNLCIGYVVTLFFIPTAGLALSFVTLLQTDVMYVAWLLFLPVDTVAKNRVMNRAMRLRSAYKNLTVIGITGSVGKTTTKELIAHIIKDQNILFTPAYVNSEMGVSKWLLKELPKKPKDEPVVAIVEMGAYKAGEIARLCEIMQPSMGVITYIGTQHIALFGSQEKLCNAKAEIIENLPKDGTAFINADNTHCQNVTSKTQANVVAVGTGGHADLEAFEIEETSSGISFRVEDSKIVVPLHGTHNVTNVLLAIAVAKELGMTVQDIAQKLRSFTPPSKTFSIRSNNGITILDDTHNASPESFRAAIAWAKSQPMDRKILLTPGLIELGEQEQRIHRELGEQASGIFTRVIVTSDTHRPMLQEGYSATVESLTKATTPLQTGDLLVCVGKVHASAIEKLLP